MAKFKIKGKKITGTKKKDKIVSTGKGEWKKAFTVNAGKGNDTLDFRKSKYKNTLNGQDGNDKIYGGKKNDKITGGKGNDTIYTGKGTNTLIINKGDGNDTIYHQGTKTIIKVNKAKANDKKEFSKNGNDLLLTYTHAGTTTKEVLTIKNYFTLKNKNIFLGKQKIETLLNSTGMKIAISDKGGNITGSSGNDTITGGIGENIIYAGAGNDFIDLANGGKNTVFGEAGADSIVNIKGNSSVDGGEGNDIITAVAGANTLKGGAGADSITGGNEYNLIEGGAGNDTIISGEYFNDISGGDGDDLINLEKGYINYVNAGAGNDSIINAKSNSYEDENNGYSTIDGGDGNDTITLISANNVVKGGAGDDSITGGSGEDQLMGDDGSDIIYAGSGKTTIDGGNGNDHLYSGGDSNLFTFGVDFGNDTIYNATSADRIYMIDTDGRYNITKNGDDIILAPPYYYDDPSDSTTQTNSVTIKDWYKAEDKFNIGKSYINVEESGDINLSDFNENIQITAGSSNITANGGYDNIYLEGKCNNTINLHPNQSLTTTIVYGYTATETQTDTINFTDGIKFSDLQTEISDENLIIKYDENSSVILKAYTNSCAPIKIKTSEGEKTVIQLLEDKGIVIINTSEPTTLTSGGNNVIVTGTANITGSAEGNDTINTGSGNDSITVNGGDENIINAGEGSNVISIAGGTAEVITGSGNDNITVGGAGASYVDAGKGINTANITSGSNTYNGGYEKDIVTVAGSNNTVNVNDGENEITVTGGSNTINTGLNNDEITLNSTIGNTVIIQGGSNTVNASTGDDVITIGGNGENIVSITGGSNTVTTGNGVDNITIEGNGDNIINTNQGNDVILTVGNSKNDIKSGAGDDSITTGGGNDTIDAGTSGNNGDTVHAGGGDDEIKINSGKAYGEDGDDKLTGTSGLLDGGSGNDTINAGWQHVSVIGGSGNDEIHVSKYKGSSNNTEFFFNKAGDGDDTIITDYMWQHEIEFTGFEGESEEEIAADKADFYANKLWYEAKGDDLIIRYATESGNSITIKDFFVPENLTKINNWKYPSYQSLSGDISLKGINIMNSTDSNDTLTLDKYPKSVYSGGYDRNVASTVTMHGGLGDDVIDCHSNNAVIYLWGDEGNDSITGNITNTTMIGGVGTDTFIDTEDSITYTASYTYQFDINAEDNDVIDFKQSKVDRYIEFINGTPDGTKNNIVTKDFIDNNVTIEKQYTASGFDYFVKYGDNRRIKLNNFSEEEVRNIYFNYQYEQDGEIKYKLTDYEYTAINVYGSDDADTIEAGNYQIIEAGSGSDTIIRSLVSSQYSYYSPKIILDVGGDEDYIWLNGTENPDSIYTMCDGNDVIIGYPAYASAVRIEDYLITENPNILKVKYGETGENYLNLADIIKNNIVYTTDNSTVNGTLYNDSITYSYNPENVTINGGRGNDTIRTPNGASTVDGGVGNDVINVQKASNNRYEFAVGDGTDTITGINNMNSSYKGQDIIYLKDATVDTVTFGYRDRDLIINYGSGDDEIVIQNYWAGKIIGDSTYYYLNSYNADIVIKDYNGGELHPQDGFIMNYNQTYIKMITVDNLDRYFNSKYTLVSGEDNSIYLGDGNDSVIGGGVKDKIEASLSAHGSKDIRITSSSTARITTSSGDDYIESSGGANDTIVSGAGDDIIKSYNGDDSIESGDGDDYISVGSGKNIIRAGEGNDTIYAGYGGNYDEINPGTGSNEINLGTSEATTGNNVARLWTESDGDTLILPYGTTSIRFDMTYLASAKYVNLEYKTTNASTGYNKIELTDLFENLYDFNISYSGQTKSIYELIATATDDQITGTGVTKDQIEYVTSTNRKIINCDDTTGAAYRRFVVGNSSNNEIETTVNNYSDSCCPTIIGGAGNDSITVTEADSSSHYYITGGAGQDVISIANGASHVHGGADDDYISVNGYTIGGSGRTRYIYGDDGNDTIKVEGGFTNEYASHDYSSVYGGDGNDLIDFRKAVGQQYLFGDDGNDTIYSGAYTSIKGGEGDDVIGSYTAKGYMNGEDGDDTIYAYYKSTSANSSSYNKSRLKDTFTYGNFTETIVGGMGNNTIHAIGENVVIYSYSRSDTINVGLTNNVKILTTNAYDSSNTGHKLYIRQTGEHAMLVFDVEASPNGENVKYRDNGLLWVTNEVSFENWVDTGSFNGNDENTRYGAIQLYCETKDINKTANTYQKIVNYYGTNSDNDYKQISRQKILEMQSDVAAWLSEEGYASVNSVITGTNEQAKTDLIAKFVEVNNNYWTDMSY